VNCKPGDLAYIIRSEIPENVGAVVEVLRLDAEQSIESGEPVWWTRSPAPTMHSNGVIDYDGVVEDSRLRPISGVPVHDEERDEVPA
jgi:hypothetical protein